MVNKNEEQIKTKMEGKGYKVLRGGWPDFLCFKTIGEEITDIRGIEVKAGADKLSYEQQIIKRIFKQLLIPYEVQYVR